jgi:hypothetical protein
MGFRKLYLKEVKSILPLFGVFLVAVVLLHFFILYKRESLDMDLIFALSLVTPFILAAIVAIGTGYYQLHVEWKTNSIYLLLALPIRGWKVLTAKLAAVFSLLVLVSIGIAVSFIVILLRVKWSEFMSTDDFSLVLPTFINVTANSSWMYGLAILFLIVIAQFAFLCGQLVSKFKWVVELGAFFAALWLVIRIHPLVSNLLIWMPDILFGGKETDVMYLHAGPFIVLAVISAGFVWLNGYIFEKEVEV